MPAGLRILGKVQRFAPPLFAFGPAKADGQARSLDFWALADLPNLLDGFEHVGIEYLVSIGFAGAFGEDFLYQTCRAA
jgi:hypothetical protein